MNAEFSSLKTEPERIRITCGFKQRLLYEPIELVDDQPAEGGREIILRSRANLARFVVADTDEDSLAIAGRLERVNLDADELQELKDRITIASKPLDPDAVHFSDEMIRRQRDSRRSWIDRATQPRTP
jgi:hypothetical protein